MTETSETVLLACRDPEVTEAVTALGLALQIGVTVLDSAEELRQRWGDARLRLVGVDMAARVVSLMPADRTWVVGGEQDDLVPASAELGVPALAVPAHIGKLAEVMNRAQHSESEGHQIAVVGASGGLGVSSLAVALSTIAARDQPTVLVELARTGGGLDLLLGAEMEEGRRWSQLARARGELGQIDGLVEVDAMHLLALDREDAIHPDQQAVASVLRSLGRSHRFIVLDAGLGQSADWFPYAQFLMLVGADVRGVAAARMRLEQYPVLAQAQLVVRRGPGRDLPPATIADALAMPLAGAVRHDSAVPRLAADGSSVAARVARRFQRDSKAIWEVVSR